MKYSVEAEVCMCVFVSTYVIATKLVLTLRNEYKFLVQTMSHPRMRMETILNGGGQ